MWVKVVWIVVQRAVQRGSGWWGVRGVWRVVGRAVRRVGVRRRWRWRRVDFIMVVTFGIGLRLLWWVRNDCRLPTLKEAR